MYDKLPQRGLDWVDYITLGGAIIELSINFVYDIFKLDVFGFCAILVICAILFRDLALVLIYMRALVGGISSVFVFVSVNDKLFLIPSLLIHIFMWIWCYYKGSRIANIPEKDDDWMESVVDFTKRKLRG